MFVTVKSALTAANEKWEASYSHSNAISVFGLIDLRLILFRNVILQRYYYEVTIKTFRFVNAHLAASNKIELANQNAAY